MSRLRGGILLLLALVAPAGLAAAQDPTINESDVDTSVPPPDESYLDEVDEPALDEADFDTSVPDPDESYLDDTEAETRQEGPGAATPGPGAAAVVLAAVVGAALAARRATRRP